MDVPTPNEPTQLEQNAFEAWAASERYNMSQHPLHWLFLDHGTYHARRGWRAGIAYAERRTLAAFAQPLSADDEVRVRSNRDRVDFTLAFAPQEPNRAAPHEPLLRVTRERGGEAWDELTLTRAQAEPLFTLLGRFLHAQPGEGL